jgi:hypothetical protein
MQIHTAQTDRSPLPGLPGNERRPALCLSAGDVLVVRWVDHLGRNYEDDTIREFMRRGKPLR